jgi:hypothetical protein
MDIGLCHRRIVVRFTAVCAGRDLAFELIGPFVPSSALIGPDRNHPHRVMRGVPIQTESCGRGSSGAMSPMWFGVTEPEPSCDSDKGVTM